MKKKETGPRPIKVTTKPLNQEPPPVATATERALNELRQLAERLETVGPVLPVGVTVSLLGVSRTHVWRLMREGRLQTEAILGGEFVCLRSVIKHAEMRVEREKIRSRRLAEQAKEMTKNLPAPNMWN
jgi:hypothetical protein